MMKILATLMRGAVADAEDAVFDANAIRVLEQQLREAAGALEHSKKELACALAHQASEQRAVSALAARLADLEQRGVEALQGARDDLAQEVATVIAAVEDERTERAEAVKRFDVDISRLRQLADDGRHRLMDLRRGLEMARAQEALHRAGANGRRALASGSGALREAEATLARIRSRQCHDRDTAAALDELERHETGRDLDDRLRDAGFGDKARTKPADVLEKMRRRAAVAHGTAGGTAPPASTQ